MVNAQEWLDENYPKEERKDIKELQIDNKNLEGKLDLVGFANLEALYCYQNQLTSLKLNNCLKLKTLNCWGNQLINLELSNCGQLEWLTYGINHLKEIVLPFQAEKLATLDVVGNGFPIQDCSIFSRLVNLQYLDINNNHFYGSLEPLKDLNKLEFLKISNNDIDRGLEYLPDSLKEFYCLTNIRKDAKVKAIEAQLKPYNGSYQAWRNNLQGELTAWQCPIFWPKPTLGQPDSAITFRTQVNSFDLLGISGTAGLCLLARHFYRKYKNSKQSLPLDPERQPLLNQTKKSRLNYSQPKFPALEAQLMVRENALKELVEQSQTKITQYEQANPEAEYENHASLLEELLDNQATLAIYQNSSNITSKQIQAVERQLKLAQNSLIHLLNAEEINEICQVKAEITELELKLEQNQAKVAQIIQPTYGIPSSSKN